jgi:hypothetical protein
VTRSPAGVPILLLDGVGNGIKMMVPELRRDYMLQRFSPREARAGRYFSKIETGVLRFIQTDQFYEGCRIFLLEGIKTVPPVRAIITDPR